ncbi:Uncharacterized protein ALO82_02122 [Pseudomonas syringae pv. broussonetiae]|nr:hypothetical protein [Pseudomonas savastanoi]KPW50378.1 Uncharacterized protein ALO82_02122 [Pseudomonas syringae pv. broussonetiae]
MIAGPGHFDCRSLQVGAHKEAALDVAQRFFQARIADGEPDSACTFVVTGMDGQSEKVDLADYLYTD